MAIRRIKAHDAYLEGDFVVVRHKSLEFQYFITTLIFAAVLILVIVINSDNYLELLTDPNFVGIALCSAFMVGIIGFLGAPPEITRLIPKEDLVEIKRYDKQQRVTVVFDDARVKKGGSPEKYKEYLKDS